MQITDLDGTVKTVIDIDAGIEQADSFRKLRHADPGYRELDKRLQAYWEDLYQKLVALKKTITIQ